MKLCDYGVVRSYVSQAANSIYASKIIKAVITTGDYLAEENV